MVQLTEFSENRQNSFRRGDHTAIKVQMLILLHIRHRSLQPHWTRPSVTWFYN